MTSIQAGPLFCSVTGILIIQGIFIHDMDAEIAKQWIGVLETITNEKETN